MLRGDVNYVFPLVFVGKFWACVAQIALSAYGAERSRTFFVEHRLEVIPTGGGPPQSILKHPPLWRPAGDQRSRHVAPYTTKTQTQIYYSHEIGLSTEIARTGPLSRNWPSLGRTRGEVRAELGRTRGNIGRDRPKLTPRTCESCPSCLASPKHNTYGIGLGASLRPVWGGFGARLGPTLPQFLAISGPRVGRNRPKFGTNSTQGRPESTTFGPSSTDLGPNSANFDDIWPGIGQIFPEIGQRHWPGNSKVDQIWPNVGQTWLELGQMLPDIGQHRPNVARYRPNLARTRPNSTNTGTLATSLTTPPVARRETIRGQRPPGVAEWMRKGKITERISLSYFVNLEHSAHASAQICGWLPWRSDWSSHWVCLAGRGERWRYLVC